jgi:hypothetical protein
MTVAAHTHEGASEQTEFAAFALYPLVRWWDGL